MSLKRCFFMILLAVTVLGGCKTTDSGDNVPKVTGKMKVAVLKAGQADAIVITTQNHSVIIDCGEKDDGDKITEYLTENEISSVDYLFITHFDKDHVGGFPEVAENITAGVIAVADYEGSGSGYDKYLKSVDENNLNVTKLTSDIFFTLDDVLFNVSVPKKQSYNEGDNDYSLVITATHGENRFFFAGDAEEERLCEVLEEFNGEYDFLKVPHHGRYNKKTSEFINTLKPSYAVITDSEKNPAEEETSTALKNIGCEIYSTKDGNVFAYSDSKTLEIVQ